MPIKKSLLEQKWYFRVAKVFFLILPLLVAGVALSRGYISLPELSQKGIQAAVQKNDVYIVYTIVGLVFYYVVLNLVWRGFIYVAFGGLDDDTKKIIATSVAGQAAPTPAQNNAAGELIAWIILIILFFFIATYGNSSNFWKGWINGNINGNINKNVCLSTGCGSLWHCAGSYYLGGQEIRINGCYLVPMSASKEAYPSWSGTCRQCP